MLLNTNNIPFTQLKGEIFKKYDVKLIVARLDLLHPVISGNKLFKLHYFLKEALSSGHKTILTFGGAYSNHLVATAFAGKTLSIKTIGVVRGEKPATLSHTLQHCIEYGMQLFFIPRDAYKNAHEKQIVEMLQQKFGECIVIPEGGYHPLGAKGAAKIMELFTGTQATHICTAVGTATTFAGLCMGAADNQQVVAVPVLKGMNDLNERLHFLTNGFVPDTVVFNDYHIGGYAKKNEALITFMNAFYSEHRIPTDFVYTAKMFYAVMDKLANGYFSPGSSIVCLHTGGLQGNKSLATGTLIF